MERGNNMPAAKGTSSNFVTVDGIKFYKTKQGYYSSAKRKRLHVYVWEQANGPVPGGCDIHHIDKNRENNQLSNLECKQRSEHHKEHMAARDKDQMRKNLNENVRPKAILWHKSSDGIAWHREQYEKTIGAHWGETVTKTCEYCGKEYQCERLKQGSSRFCSNNCKAQWRRVSGIDNETRICVVCGKEFQTNKYSKVKTCSKECSNISQSRAKIGKPRPHR